MARLDRGEWPDRSAWRIVIAETRPAVARGLQILLTDTCGIETVSICADFDRLDGVVAREEADMVLIGRAMPGATSLAKLNQLRLRCSSIRLALLADEADRDTILAGLRAGASGIVAISSQTHEFRSAIDRMMSGNIFIPNSIALMERHATISSMGRAESRMSHADPLHQRLLTARQHDVVQALTLGRSNKQIARMLAISESTVKAHLNAAFHALGVHDRTTAALAFERASQFSRTSEAKSDLSMSCLEFELLN